VLGVAAQVVQKLRQIGGASGPIKFRGVFLAIDSEAVKFALDEVCGEVGVEVLLHAQVVRAERDGGLIRQVTYHDHNGNHDVDGKAFVDASGDCDLAFFAGASTRYGNHGFINLGTLGTRFGGIKPGADLDANTWTAAIRKARSDGVAPLSKDRSLVMRVPLSNDVIAYLASEVYDARDAKSISRAGLEREKVLESFGVQMIRLNKFNLGKDPVATIDGLLRERLDGMNNGRQPHDLVKSVAEKAKRELGTDANASGTIPWDTFVLMLCSFREEASRRLALRKRSSGLRKALLKPISRQPTPAVTHLLWFCSFR
jgi:FAD dependent oxidoreductase